MRRSRLIRRSRQFRLGVLDSEKQVRDRLAYPDVLRCVRPGPPAPQVEAGKEAARWIACEVCEERLLSLFPSSGDADSIDHFIEGETLVDSLGDAKSLCSMRPCAGAYGSGLGGCRRVANGWAWRWADFKPAGGGGLLIPSASYFATASIHLVPGVLSATSLGRSCSESPHALALSPWGLARSARLLRALLTCKATPSKSQPCVPVLG